MISGVTLGKTKSSQVSTLLRKVSIMKRIIHGHGTARENEECALIRELKRREA